MRTIYLDMDGVVADFDAYAYSVLGHKSDDGRWHRDKWLKLRDNPRMYSQLPLTQEANALVEFCRSYCLSNNYTLLFLTAVPKNNDVHWAFYDKVLWAQQYFPDIPVMFGPFSKDKHVHCHAGDVLIDDRTSNINKWIAAGGIGIRHQHGNLENTINQLKAIDDKNSGQRHI